MAQKQGTNPPLPAPTVLDQTARTPSTSSVLLPMTGLLYLKLIVIKIKVNKLRTTIPGLYEYDKWFAY